MNSFLDIQHHIFPKICFLFSLKTIQRYFHGFLFSLVLSALSKINEAIDSGDPDAILRGLQNPSAKLNNVRPKNAELYAIVLREAKVAKAKVRTLPIKWYYLFF